MNAYKPDEYASLSPYLVVKGADQLMALLKHIFGAEDLRRYEGPGGRVMHAEIRIDDSVLMISESQEGYPPRQQMLHVYVADVDGVYARALAAGCEPLQEPKKSEGDADKRGGFRDPAGNEWWIATQEQE